MVSEYVLVWWSRKGDAWCQGFVAPPAGASLRASLCNREFGSCMRQRFRSGVSGQASRSSTHPEDDANGGFPWIWSLPKTHEDNICLASHRDTVLSCAEVDDTNQRYETKRHYLIRFHVQVLKGGVNAATLTSGETWASLDTSIMVRCFPLCVDEYIMGKTPMRLLPSGFEASHYFLGNVLIDYWRGIKAVYEVVVA